MQQKARKPYEKGDVYSQRWWQEWNVKIPKTSVFVDCSLHVRVLFASCLISESLLPLVPDLCSAPQEFNDVLLSPMLQKI